jgi:hypothetical protein
MEFDKLLRRCKQLPREQQKELIIGMIRDIIAEELGIKPEEIEIPLIEKMVNIDSIRAVIEFVKSPKPFI